MKNKTHNNLYFHIGLPRTGTTFLQNSLFNNINNINYILKPNFSDIKNKIIKNKINLVSDEGLLGNVWDGDRFQAINRIYKHYPHAKIIIGFRMHDKWVQSMYSLYLKRGGSLKVQEFLDLKNNNGVLNTNQLNFSKLLIQIRNKFSSPPFVYFLEDIENNNQKLLKNLENFLELKFSNKKINFKSPKNRGLNGKQKELCRKINSFFISKYNQRGFVKLNFINKFNLYPIKISSFFYSSNKNKVKFKDKWFYDELKLIYKDDWELLVTKSRT